jgi:fatty acid desaturase
MGEGAMAEELQTVQSVRSATLGDACVRDIPRLVSKAELKALSKIDSTRFTAAVLIEVATVVAAIAVSEYFHNPVVYVLAVIVIGTRINAFGALMHDAAHYRAYTNRLTNDIVGELLALPTTTSMAGYRNTHFAHHRALNGENDPDWNRDSGREEFSFPVPPKVLAGRVLRYLVGLKILASVGGYHSNDQTRDIPVLLARLRLAFFALLLIGSVISFSFGKLIVLYWLVPLVTAFLAVRYLRSVAEHYAVEHEDTLNETRTVLAPAWERWLVAPWGLNYHLEHHLYPSVPCFRLHELHALLMTREPFPELAHITHGYFTGLFRDASIFADPRHARAKADAAEHRAAAET